MRPSPSQDLLRQPRPQRAGLAHAADADPKRHTTRLCRYINRTSHYESFTMSGTGYNMGRGLV